MIDAVALAGVHGGVENVREGCEEVLALDTEHLPDGVGEVDQVGAAAWGEPFAEIGGNRQRELLIS